MKNIKNRLQDVLTSKLADIFGPQAQSKLKIEMKSDLSIVTDIDHFVSGLIKQMLSESEEFAHFHYYSEEDHGDFHFPCAIVDPIDGTRELARGRAECAVSLALMQSPDLYDRANHALIYNPFSGFWIDSLTPSVAPTSYSSQKLLALVSRSEYARGEFLEEEKLDLWDISPRGSIAFKLGLLAAGACDVVISKVSKNVWDVAGGSVLCAKRGIHFYVNGKKIDHLDAPAYHGTLVWASSDVAAKVLPSLGFH